MTHYADDQKKLRQNLRERRSKLSKTEVAVFGKRASEVLLRFLRQYPDVEHMLCYYPLGNEVDLRPLYEELLMEGKKLYFPVTGDALTFYRVTSLQDFSEGTFHVMEPANPTEEFPEAVTAICFTPGVVFDQSGNRYGFGKGYYDRFLSSHDDILKIGISYPFQMLRKIEKRPWDIPMDVMLPNIMEENHAKFD